MTKAAVFIGGVAAGLAAIGLFRDAASRAQPVPTFQPALTATTYRAPDPAPGPIVYANTFRIGTTPDVVVLDLGTTLPRIDGLAEGEYHVGAPVAISYPDAKALSAALAHLHRPDGRVSARHTPAGTAPAP